MANKLKIEKIRVPKKNKNLRYDTTSRQAIIQAWLTSISTIPWYISDQTLDPPQPENITRGYIRIADIERTGQDGIMYTPDTDPEKLNFQAYAFREMTFVLDVYSIDQSANYVLQDVLCYFNVPSTIEYFSKHGFGIVNYSNIRNLCLLSSGRWLNRYQVDVKFNILDSVFNTIDVIDKAPVEGIYS